MYFFLLLYTLTSEHRALRDIFLVKYAKYFHEIGIELILSLSDDFILFLGIKINLILSHIILMMMMTMTMIIVAKILHD